MSDGFDLAKKLIQCWRHVLRTHHRSFLCLSEHSEGGTEPIAHQPYPPLPPVKAKGPVRSDAFHTSFPLYPRLNTLERRCAC